ncbi:fibroblast growth factor receptor 2 [Ceratobasidium sp. AG-Ba]|nr:fibroblast growth factor receptor 2 [Ceratobasidium sp. AG-Ba]
MDQAISSAPPAYAPADSYSLETRKTATFAQVESKIEELARIPPLFYNALEAFRDYMAGEEVAKVSREQLGVLRALSVVVFEISAKRFHEGIDISETLNIITQILRNLASDIQSNELWKYAIQNNNLAKYLETKIWAASEALEAELRKLLQIAKRLKTVQESMQANLKIIGDPTVQHKQVEAKRALAILTELTGASLPPSTLLGKDFVTIGPYSIHSSATFEIFRGRYFTGEEIAIKLLRHRVDKETAKRTHEGVADSPVGSGEVQLYMVSPYLQNQDVRRYLRKYPTAPLQIRLQMTLDVARGLQHMHETTESPEQGNGIVHSALNIFNILIKDSGRAVISGFGHAKVIRDFYENFTGDNSEYRYMGPEMMQDEAKITHGTDIWSWAMTALEILTDVPPFGEKTKGPRLVTLLAQRKRPQRSDHPKIEEYHGADKLWDLFTECWEEDPVARPTADDVVRRVSPILRELGRRKEAVEQGKEPTSLPDNQAGRSDPRTQAGQPPAPVPGQAQLGKPDYPVVPAPAPENPNDVPGQQDLGKATPAVAPGKPTHP